MDLHSLRRQEIEWVRQLHNDSEVLSVLTDTHEVTHEEQKKWFERLSSSTSSKRLVVTMDDVPIGLARLDEIDFINGSTRVGLDIHKDSRGRGYARPAYNLLLNYCFEDLRMNRVYLMVADFNERAYSLYKKLGFIEEGKMREALLRNGSHHDYIIMSILRREYVIRYQP